MNWWLWTIVIVYGTGFVGVAALEIGSGPVTLGLALLRAALWPIFLATGWPGGMRFPMD